MIASNFEKRRSLERQLEIFLRTDPRYLHEMEALNEKHRLSQRSWETQLEM